MSEGHEPKATQARPQATTATYPPGVPRRRTGRSSSSSRRRSDDAQFSSSAHGGPDGPGRAEGTPPSGTPSPARDRGRGTSRDTSGHPPDNSRPSPGQAALSAQSGAPTGHAPPLTLLGPLRRTIQHAGRSTAPGRDPHPSLLDYTHAATGARVLPPNPWAGGFTPAPGPTPVAAEPAAGSNRFAF